MRSRAFLSNVLTDLELAQFGDQPRPQSDAQEQRRDSGESGAEGDVTENAKRADLRASALKAANDGEIAALRAQEPALIAARTDAQRAIDVALAAAANAEIEQLKADYRAAAETFFRGPHAQLLAAGILSCELAQNLSAKYGLGLQPVGGPAPDRSVVLNPVGFNFSDDGAYNRVRVDVGPAIDAAYIALKEKWSR